MKELGLKMRITKTFFKIDQNRSLLLSELVNVTFLDQEKIFPLGCLDINAFRIGLS